MKLRLIAFAAAVLVGQTAFAAPAVDVNDAATVKVYMSGASALRGVLSSLVATDICGGYANNSSITVYNMSSSLALQSGKNDWAITCALPAAGAAKVGLATGTKIAFFKTDAGGSAQGVFPVSSSLNLPFIDVTACTTVGTPDRVYSNCPVTASVKPHFGVSDLEPGMFRGVNSPNDQAGPNYGDAGLTAGEILALQITPVVQTVFAVAVNNNLYNDMFAFQGLNNKFASTGAACSLTSTDENCIPSIGRAVARAFFAGSPVWTMLVGTGAGTKAATQMNICRRVQGSGTQAAANMAFADVGCSANSLSPTDVSGSDTASAEPMSAFTGKTLSGLTPLQYAALNMGATLNASGAPVYNGAMPAGGTFVFEGPGTGDVISCTTAAQQQGGYAIGHISKENAPKTDGSEFWKHVRLENVAPSRDNAKNGNYDYVVESTIQYKKADFANFSASVKTFITKFIAEVKKPSALNNLSANAQNGVLALPTSYTDLDPSVSADASVVKFGSRVSRGGLTCNPLQRVN